MDPITDMIFYGVLMVGGIAFLIYKKTAAAPKHCPQCNNELPRVRVPTSLSEALWGGWTCEKCGTEIKVDFYGNIKTKKK